MGGRGGGNGEVRVEKVEKIRYVRDVETKPSVYRREAAATAVVRRKPAADVTIYGSKIGPPLQDRVASREDIDEYIRRKKLQFNQPS